MPEGSDWTFEIKLDGYHAIGVRTSREAILYSRNGKTFNKRYPHIAEALRDLPPETVIDGEVVALDDSGRPDFHRLQHFTAEASCREISLTAVQPPYTIISRGPYKKQRHLF